MATLYLPFWSHLKVVPSGLSSTISKKFFNVYKNTRINIQSDEATLTCNNIFIIS